MTRGTRVGRAPLKSNGSGKSASEGESKSTAAKRKGRPRTRRKTTLKDTKKQSDASKTDASGNCVIVFDYKSAVEQHYEQAERERTEELERNKRLLKESRERIERIKNDANMVREVQRLRKACRDAECRILKLETKPSIRKRANNLMKDYEILQLMRQQKEREKERRLSLSASKGNAPKRGSKRKRNPGNDGERDEEKDDFMLRMDASVLEANAYTSLVPSPSPTRDMRLEISFPLNIVNWSGANDSEELLVHEEDVQWCSEALNLIRNYDDGVRNQLSNEDVLERAKKRLETEFCRMFRTDEVKTEFIQRDRCERCDCDLVRDIKTSQLKCPGGCGRSRAYIDYTGDSLAYGQDCDIAEHLYVRNKYFRTWFSQYRKGAPATPDHVMRKLLRYLQMTLDYSVQKVKPTTVDKALKKLGFAKYCIMHDRITSRVQGLPIAEFNDFQFERIVQRIKMMQIPWVLLKLPGRKNFPNFTYCVNKIVQMESWLHFQDCFGLRRTHTVVVRLDIQLRRICNMLENARQHPNQMHWPFFRTV